jgi:hypothetical protein
VPSVLNHHAVVLVADYPARIKGTPSCETLPHYVCESAVRASFAACMGVLPRPPPLCPAPPFRGGPVPPPPPSPPPAPGGPPFPHALRRAHQPGAACAPPPTSAPAASRHSPRRRRAPIDGVGCGLGGGGRLACEIDSFDTTECKLCAASHGERFPPSAQQKTKRSTS